MGVEPLAALPALEEHLSSIPGRADATAFASTFVVQLVGGRRSLAPNTRGAFQTPGVLKNLYLLMHRYVRLQDNTDRAGKGVYSPELRDYAQDARGQLSAMLQAIPGKEAFLALTEVAETHHGPQSRSWFQHLAKSRAESDADGSAWLPGQVREFHLTLER